MSKYLVTVPLVGYSSCIVEADNEDEAKDKAYEICCSFEDENVELQELYGVDKVVEGNVCKHPFWNIDVEEAE